MSPTSTFLTLVRREFWEHRGLWAAPLVVAVMLVVFTALSGGMIRGPVQIEVNGQEADFVAAMTGPGQRKFFGVVVAGLMVPQLLIALVVVFFYLLDSLYSERKDRSILFWKSLPVSDAMTVASKAAVALLAVPLIVYGLALVASLLVFGIAALKFSGTPFAPLITWHMGDWFVLQGVLLLNMLIAALWYFPVAAGLLLVSAAARRGTVLWAIVPPLILVAVERSVFGTDRVFRFLGYRFTGFFDAMGVHLNRSVTPTTAEQVDRVTTLYERINAAPLLLNVDLWLGVAAAVALLAIAIRLRRWRDDT
jgi:ABC-2 type transport system permease protein